MRKLSPKENLLRLIRFQDPEYIPYGLESTKGFTQKEALSFKGSGDPNVPEWPDAWGVGYKAVDKSISDNPYPVSHPLKSYEQLESFKFPNPADPELFSEIEEQIKSVNRQENLIMFSNPHFLFVRSWLLRGMEEALTDILTDPENYEALLEKIYLYQEAIIKRTLEFKPDIILFGDDAATTKDLMMNPALWRKMIKPRLKKFFDLCRDAGCFVYLHCCGCIEDILDDVIEIGADILNPIQASANDFRYVKDRAKGKLVLLGGIDAHKVYTGDPEAVADLTRKTMGILGEGGGYIAAVDQSLPFPKENIEAIKKVVLEEGSLK